MVRGLTLFLAAGAWAGAALAVPPPPPGRVQAVTAIITPPTEAGMEAYLALFSEDVKVFEANTPMGVGRPALEKYLRRKLGLYVTPLKVAYGNPIMVAETVSNISYRGPNTVQDCCYWARFSTYHTLPDGEVDEVRYLENGAFW